MSKAITKEEDIQKIVELYNSGLSTIKIGDIYGVHPSTINKILKNNNVKIRDNSHKGRLYTINENYFNSIDTQNKAYILGLLYADGCNYPPQYRVKLELQERDKDILDKINVEIGSNKPLYFNELNKKNSNWQNTYRLDITNKNISNVLNDLGLIQNKSLILQFPDWLDKSLYPHFIRGYFDGDGCISKYFLTIASTREFCEKIVKIVDNEINILASIYNLSVNPTSNTKIFHINGISNMQKFLDWIYKDAELYIQRKYDTYKNIHYQIAI